MGKTITPTYRIEMTATGWMMSPAAWDCKRDGRPTDATLEAHIKAFEASTQPGGVNAHLGATSVRKARVIRQATDETVASYERPRYTFTAFNQEPLESIRLRRWDTEGNLLEDTTVDVATEVEKMRAAR